MNTVYGRIEVHFYLCIFFRNLEKLKSFTPKIFSLEADHVSTGQSIQTEIHTAIELNV